MPAGACEPGGVAALAAARGVPADLALPLSGRVRAPGAVLLPLAGGSCACPRRSPYGFAFVPGGRLRILVRPRAAVVDVDGVRLERPAEGVHDIGVLAGEHVVEARARGFLPRRMSVTVGPGAVETVEIRLEPHRGAP